MPAIDPKQSFPLTSIWVLVPTFLALLLSIGKHQEGFRRHAASPSRVITQLRSSDTWQQ